MKTELTFSLAPERRTPGAVRGVSALGEGELRYELLLGDLVLRIGGVTFRADWGWVPILDVAVGLRRIIEELDGGQAEAVLDFTENEHEIRFAREGALVSVSSTFTDGAAQVLLDDLRAAVRDFDHRAFDAALARYPELTANPWFMQSLPDR